MRALLLAVALALAAANVSANGTPQPAGSPVSLHLGDSRNPSATERIGAMTVHGTLSLDAFKGRRGGRLRGISGLAWSDDLNTLFAVSDQGHLWKWRPRFEAQRLVKIDVLGVTGLRDTNGKRLLGKYSADSEGLAILDGHNGDPDDDRLLVSFELRPRVGVFDRNGRQLSRAPLPARFAQVHNYAEKNKAIEAVAAIPGVKPGRYWMLAATERPMRGSAKGLSTLFTTSGHEWHYPLGDGPNIGLVAMQHLPNGALVFVERGYSALPPRLFARITYVPHLPAPGTRLQPRTLAEMSTLRGHRIDNMEALAHHRDNRFFIASDDNNNLLQRTLLMYVELDW